ncbi:MAG: alpha-D-ribose 1-methylphosphonate 5-triphosphate diphosphatase [Azospirillum sp.]|nr:alpha-D-ribose 1-methylphosphonate 5-triphosphate diphosphatase [Azospirillum sp.]
MAWCIEGGKVLTADGVFAECAVTIEDGRIAALGDAPDYAGRRWQAGGRLVLPGIVDLHGDAFERQLMPRPGVAFPFPLALADTDRQLVANGITTAFHGVTYSWEPGLRGRDSALAVLAAVEAARPWLACDTRIHLRFETFNLAAEREVADWLAAGRIDLLAFNDHIEHIAEKLAAAGDLGVFTGRTGLTASAFRLLFEDVRERRREVPAAIERLAAAARAVGLPMASHDDESPEMRAWFHQRGCRLCEFPVDAATATAAREQGDPVILGAPNVVRRGSHCGRLAAADAVDQRLCSVLASDYHYPALVAAAFQLVRERRCRLAEAWALVSANPAAAAGLADRGVLEPGRRADLVVVEDRWPAAPPEVVATVAAGRPVFMAADLGR